MPNMPDALLLCGGAGLRLRSVIGDAPKGMAEVAGRPFLELLLRQLHRHGFKRAILAVGYQQDAILSHFGERSCGLRLTYSAESCPLGTGGALRNAADLIESESVLVMNGDSYTDVDLSKFLADCREAKADASVVVVPADGRRDCGFVLINGDGRLASFEEKQAPRHAPYVNAGVYILSRQLLYEIPAGVEISLERTLLPRWLQQGRYIKGFIYSGRCVDIGTPERYRNAQSILANIEADVCTSQSESQL
ncbi:MAG: nucleotidyltransferase family protein [Candidatus Korobacteraceae bacterium]